jgi:hypothetical protein
MMTLNRYLLVGKDHSPWLVTIAKLEFKWMIRGSLLFSALINIGHGWQYQTDVAMIITQKDEQSNFNMDNYYAYSDYPHANHDLPYFIYSIVYFCINFGFFFILNTGLEVKIVRRMQKELKEKRERFAKMNAKTPTSVSDKEGISSDKINEEKRREEEDKIKENMVIKMVVINGFLNFILRTPDMLFWVEYKNILEALFNERSPPGLLNFIADIGCFAYILTFSANFFIFYKYNKNFNSAVEFIWTRKSTIKSK